jgi:8-oxo-dGTP pyrophosphatase MutT (NUDIX family)
MDIFIGNRTISLREQSPEKPGKGEIIFEYSSLEQMKNAFMDFEKSDSLANLCFWSGSRYSKMTDDFLSMFRYIEAAGGVVRNDRNEILVISRFGKWDLPKGKIAKERRDSDFGHGKETRYRESPEEAAVREVMEETGIKHLSLKNEVPSTYHVFYRNEKRFLKRTYWYEMTASADEELIPQKEEDITDVRWIRREEIPMILENTYASLREIFLRIVNSV